MLVMEGSKVGLLGSGISVSLSGVSYMGMFSCENSSGYTSIYSIYFVRS